MKAIVVGAGSMGVPLACGLTDLNFKVTLIDSNPDQFSKIPENYHITTHTSLEDYTEADVCISAAPYHQNVEIAKHCFNNKIRYCDLGGRPDVSDTIKERAQRFQIVGMPDLGLAPGYVNILAEEVYRKNEGADTILMRVGGLPEKPVGTLKYSRTWSIDGLVNEYCGSCKVIENGVLKTEQAMDGLEDYFHPGCVLSSMGNLEAFYTKGGMATTLESMSNKGVKNCNYKTLRYKGHADIIKFMINECKLSDAEFKKILSVACPITKKDIVLISAESKRGGWNEGLHAVIKHDNSWTAMQKATAFPAATVASIIADGLFDDVVVPTYADIPYELFAKRLKILLPH